MASPVTHSNCRAQINRLLADRILVLDGAWGTLLQSRGLEESDFRGERFASHPRDLQGNYEMLTLTRPDLVEGVHQTYFAAGADIAETNTFNSNRVSQADSGMEHVVAEQVVMGLRRAGHYHRKIRPRNIHHSHPVVLHHKSNTGDSDGTRRG